MSAPLSIIIPTLNAAGQLPATVAILFEGLENGLVRELIISDGNSDDATAKIAEDLGAKFVTGLPGRGGQLRRGADVAGAEWLLFLHADTHLSPSWSDVVLNHIQYRTGAGYFSLRFRADGFRPRFFEAGANLRSRLGLPYGDQGLLISRGLYDQIGGYPDIALMEDVAIAGALRGHLAKLPATANTNAARYQKSGWYRRGIRNMWTLLLYRLGIAPDKLAIYYNQ